MSSGWDEPSSSFQPKENIEEFEFFKQNLKPLDELLRCRICFEYFNVCMMTKCSHNYCSLCIRRYMTYKSQCPTCFQAASEPELRNNRIVDEMLKVYKDIREILCQGHVKSNVKKRDDDSRTRGALEIHSQSSNTALDISIPSDQEDHHLKGPLDKVSCPVCSVSVLTKNINIHLDSCLASGKCKASIESKEKRPTLPKVVYHLLSDRDLKKRLKDCGLSTQGDRRALIRRHKNFIVLYNAECDSLKPRPVLEIIKEIETEEKAERFLETNKKVFCFDSKTDPEVIEEQQIMYLKQHNKQFKELVEDICFRKERLLSGEQLQEYDQKSDGAVAGISQCFDGDGGIFQNIASLPSLPSDVTDNLSNSEPDCIILEGQLEDKSAETTCDASLSEKQPVIPKNSM